VTETGLLIAQAAFIVLLYGFIWMVVRSSGKQVGVAAPAPVTTSAHDPIAPITDLDAQPLEAEDEPDLFEARSVAAGAAAAAVIPEPPAPQEEMPVVPIVEEPAVATPGEPGESEPVVPVAEKPAEEEEEEEEESRGFGLSGDLEPRLVVEKSEQLEPGKTFPLEGGMTIGRSPSSGVLVDDEFVSHMHARVMRRGEFYFISDLGSTNGTKVNGKAVAEDRQLRVRDEIQVGETVLRYEE